MERGAWLARVQGLAKSQTRLSNFLFCLKVNTFKKKKSIHLSVKTSMISLIEQNQYLLDQSSDLNSSPHIVTKIFY